MTPISRATWALLGLAVLASGACVWALLDLGRAPPSTASVPVAGHRLFVQAADDGLSVLTDRSSFRVLPDLTIEERQWPTGVRLRSVDSAATLGDVSLFLVRPASLGPAGCGCRHAHMHGSMPPNLLLRVDRESVTFVPVDRTAGPLLGVRARGAHLELWRLSPSSVASTPAPDPELQARGIEEHWLTTSMPLDAVEGVVFEHNEPLLVVTHKFAHWLVDTKGALRPMPGGALSLWTPSFLRPPSSSPWRQPFVDEEVSVFAFVPGSSALAFTAGATPTDIDPLIVTHGDEPGIFASTAASGEHVEVKHIRRRVWVRGSSAERWQPLAISTSAADFVAYPVAGGFIALSEPPPESFLGGYSRDDDEGGEAVAFDAHLMRTDRAGTSSVATLTGASQGVWVALTALLLGSLCLLPLVVVRLRRRFAIDEDDLYVGFLRAAPGAVVSTSFGRAMVGAGTCQLASPRGVFELAAAPTRIDEASERPLIDGDAVYVVGRPENRDDTQNGGPWRAAHRARLGAAGELYLIGRGGAQELARNIDQRFNFALAQLVVVHLAAAVFLFGLLHVRPFF